MVPGFVFLSIVVLLGRLIPRACALILGGLLVLINSELQVFKSCADDDARPTLGCVSIVSDAVWDPESGEITSGEAGGDMVHGRALATNGFILAVVPVLLAKNDQAGLIGREAMAAAFKASRRLREEDVKIGLDQDGFIVLADGAMIPRTPYPSNEYSQFPDVDPVIPSVRFRPVDRQYHLMALNFNWGLLKNLALSIGCKISDRGVGARGSAFPRLSFGRVSADGGTTDPIIVDAADRSVSAGLVAPFGLLMPMHQTSSADYFAQD
jgi:hypothetical protein